MSKSTDTVVQAPVVSKSIFSALRRVVISAADTAADVTDGTRNIAAAYATSTQALNIHAQELVDSANATRELATAKRARKANARRLKAERKDLIAANADAKLQAEVDALVLVAQQQRPVQA